VAVLVVDDSSAIRLILKKMLLDFGFDVLEATNGRDALERLAEAGPVGLALVDWNMPEMNGFEFVQAVRTDPTRNGMRIMMVTTETEIEQVRLALDAGADEYVMKPFTPDIISEKIQLLGLDVV